MPSRLPPRSAFPNGPPQPASERGPDAGNVGFIPPQGHIRRRIAQPPAERSPASLA